MSELSCVILAGGLGTRLGSVLNGLPKCLAPVGDRSFLEVQMDALHRQGLNRFVLSLGHGSNQVLSLLERLSLPYRVDVAVEPERLGTGGGLLFAMTQAGLEECLAVNGDTHLEAAIGGMFVPLDRAAGELMSIATVEVPERARYGGVDIRNGRVQAFLEKGVNGPGPINAGLYRLSLEAFDGWVSGQPFSLESEVMPALVARGSLGAVATGGQFIDIGVPDDYRRFCDLYAHG